MPARASFLPRLRLDQFSIGGFGAAGGADCGCCAPGCTANFQLRACNGQGLPGMVVGVYTANPASGGTLMGSGTTDSSGNVEFPLSGGVAGGFYYTKVTLTGEAAVRLNPYGQFLTFDCAGSQQAIQLTAATGYHCASVTGCLLPLKNTLDCTSAILGGHTLTWTSGNWVSGFFHYTYPGCPPNCAAIDPVQVQILYAGGTVVEVQGPASPSSPGSSLVCPLFASPTGTAVEANIPGTLDCPPTFEFSGSGDGSAQSYLYCGATDTITITEP